MLLLNLDKLISRLFHKQFSFELSLLNHLNMLRTVLARNFFLIDLFIEAFEQALLRLLSV